MFFFQRARCYRNEILRRRLIGFHIESSPLLCLMNIHFDNAFYFHGCCMKNPLYICEKRSLADVPGGLFASRGQFVIYSITSGCFILKEM